jgi:hypothetical protein
MKIYAISGLGADKRVFSNLSLNYDIVHLDWIEPKPNESISEYSLRLSRLIDQKEDLFYDKLVSQVT